MMFLIPVVCCCLLLGYPVLGAPATKPEGKMPAVDKADVRQASKYTTEVVQGCSLYLNTFTTTANNSIPFQHCFVEPRPYNSTRDVFELLAQDLRSAQSLLNYIAEVKNKECKNLTESLYRCAFVSTNTLETLQKLVETLQDIVPTDMQDNTTDNSGQTEGTSLDDSNQDSSCWSVDDDRQQWNFYELQGLMTIINIDITKLEDGTDKSTPPPLSKAA